MHDKELLPNIKHSEAIIRLSDIIDERANAERILSWKKNKNKSKIKNR